MRSYKYLIIGGGMTADAAVGGIRELDTEGSLGMISSDADPPYDRPPLTKGLWKDKPLESVWRHTEQHNVDLFQGRTAASIDVKQKTVTDDNKEIYSYTKLLLATGGTPRRLPFGGEDITSTPTSSTWVMKRWVKWTPAGAHWRTGRNRIAKGWSIIKKRAECGVCCSGTFLDRWMPRES